LSVNKGLIGAKVREAVLLPIRPSSYAWVRIGRLGIIGATVGLVVALVLIFGFHLLWPTFFEPALALMGGGALTASLIQNFREEDSGYTTLPWRAGELELRDPTDGRILVPAGAGVRFDSLKDAREWSGSTHVATVSGGRDGDTAPSA
jgi:hypothetical protein